MSCTVLWAAALALFGLWSKLTPESTRATVFDCQRPSTLSKLSPVTPIPTRTP